MIETARQAINAALSKIDPPFNAGADEIKLSGYIYEADRIKLTYEILRNVRRSKSEENLSPYREMGMTMQVGRNS